MSDDISGGVVGKVRASRIILWRHGRTEYNLQGRFQGQIDIPLDEVGRGQAESAATYLALEEPAAIVSSDLSRAHQTAQALASRVGLEVEIDEGLREINAGEWEGLTRPEILEHWPDEFHAWRRGDFIRIGGGETRPEVAQRVAASILDHAQRVDGTLVIVSHGAALRGATLELLGLPLEQWGSFVGLSNAHWTILDPGESGGLRMKRYNQGPPGAKAGVAG